MYQTYTINNVEYELVFVDRLNFRITDMHTDKVLLDSGNEELYVRDVQTLLRYVREPSARAKMRHEMKRIADFEKNMDMLVNEDAPFAVMCASVLDKIAVDALVAVVNKMATKVRGRVPVTTSSQAIAHMLVE
jgi:TATA-binding protein-associated factor Taf7